MRYLRGPLVVVMGAAVLLLQGLEGQTALRAADVTFTKDVAPILQAKCQVCHRPHSVAPMSLLTYEAARPWARAMKQQVVTRTMPPWTLDKNVGIQKMKYDRSLDDREIATIAAWADAGAPRGNPADMPPPREFPDAAKWTLLSMLGAPDLIVPIPSPMVVPAKGPNSWPNLESESGLTEDRWIRAIETKPSAESFAAVHHAASSGVNPDGSDSFHGEYSLGKTGEIFPEGAGMLIKAGAKVRFNLHYGPIGKEMVDRTAVALWFHPKGYIPKYKVEKVIVGRVDELDLPPGERNIRHDGYTFLKQNVRVITFQPHMHNRGQRQCLEAIYPDDGRVETLNCVNWDFGWHISYTYADDVQPLLPKGTVLHTISWHDNSKANRWNPDAENWTGWGQRTSDDMSHTHLNWYALSDEEFKKAVAQRRLRQTRGSGTPLPVVD